MTVTYSQRIAGIHRVENDNITYGPAIKIDGSNIDQLGLSDDIVTHHMDENGTLSTIIDEHPFSYDYEEDGPQDFLKKFGMDDGSPEGANPAFMIQTVEIDDAIHGYFVFNALGEMGDIGLYLDTCAINPSETSPEILQELAPAEDTLALPSGTNCAPAAKLGR